MFNLSTFCMQLDFLPGKQVYFGETDAEGGFELGAVAVANLLEASSSVINGVQYYNLSLLTRTTDEDEGGKHQLIKAAVKDGKLYLCKAEAEDKKYELQC